MTQLTSSEVECVCGKSFNMIYAASINTWLSSDLVKELLTGNLYTFGCKACGRIIRLSTRVLINAPSVMCWVSTNGTTERLKESLISRRVIDNSGRVVDSLPIMIGENPDLAKESTRPKSPKILEKNLRIIARKRRMTHKKDRSHLSKEETKIQNISQQK